jgi:hypothetical protein
MALATANLIASCRNRRAILVHMAGMSIKIALIKTVATCVARRFVVASRPERGSAGDVFVGRIYSRRFLKAETVQSILPPPGVQKVSALGWEGVKSRAQFGSARGRFLTRVPSGSSWKMNAAWSPGLA